MTWQLAKKMENVDLGELGKSGTRGAVEHSSFSRLMKISHKFNPYHLMANTLLDFCMY